MIKAHFEFLLPNQYWKNLYENSGETPFPHKFWELNVYSSNIILGFGFQFSTQKDHAGLFMSISLFRFTVEFQVYDCRNWDDEKNYWEVEK